jgi:hypothetical protein
MLLIVVLIVFLAAGRGDTEQVVARWRSLVAFIKALDLLCLVICTVSFRRTAMAIKMVSKVDTFCIVVLFAVTLAAAGAIWSE